KQTMKSKIFMVMLLGFFLTAFAVESYADIDCVVHRKTKPGENGYFDWKEKLEACYDSGVNCVIEPCDQTKSGIIDITPNGDYSLHLNLDFVDLKHKVTGPNGDEWIPVHRDGSNYTFTNLDYIEITECNEIPTIVGKRIELDGIQTDASGNYTVIIPHN
ncbi:MAG: hypothetical protein ACPL1A_10075, partial [Candidatus Kapaibacteriota bacterium]